MPWQRSFQLKDFHDFWRISPITFHDGTRGALELKKELLEHGARKTQNQWFQYSTAASINNEFHAGSAPLHYALKDLLCENNDHPRYKDKIEEMRSFLERSLQQPLCTLSIPYYHPMPEADQINHPQGPKSYIASEHLFGRDGYLKHLWDADRMCASLLGQEDACRVDQVSQWLCQKDTYLSREQKKQSHKDMGRIELSIDSNSFWIEVGFSLRVMNPALGMRIRSFKRRNL